MVKGVMIKRTAVILFVLCIVMVLCGCDSDVKKSGNNDAPVYEIESMHQVNGRQAGCLHGRGFLLGKRLCYAY